MLSTPCQAKPAPAVPKAGHTSGSPLGVGRGAPELAPGELHRMLLERDVCKAALRLPQRVTWALFYGRLCTGPFHSFLVLFLPDSSRG